MPSFISQNISILNSLIIKSSIQNISTDHQSCHGGHVALLAHVILIPRQPVFALSPECCGEATNINCIVFGLTRPRIERTRGKHADHYTIDAVASKLVGDHDTIDDLLKYFELNS
jgi:hypothetical protein